MSIDPNDLQWQQRFRQALPNVPLPPTTLLRARNAVQAELARRGSTRLEVSWIEKLTSMFGASSPRRSFALGGIAFALLAFFFAAVLMFNQSAPTQTAQVQTTASGMIYRSQTQRVENLAAGNVARVESGDVVTATSGTLTIAYAQNMRTELSAGASVVVNSFTRNNNGTQVEAQVNTGETRNFAELQPTDKFEVKTLSGAVASVKGDRASAEQRLASLRFIPANADLENRFIVESLSATASYFASQVGSLQVATTDGQSVELKQGEEAQAETGKPLVAQTIGTAKATPTPIPPPTQTPQPTNTPQPTPTPTQTPTHTPTPTSTPTLTSTPTRRPIPTDAPLPIPPSPFKKDS
jgi:hypothetical protein